jgi:putative transferase (TIGR04331 family)
MSRFLIFTADKRTWKSDRKLIFLGLWCLSKKELLNNSNLDYIFSRPYGVKSSEKNNDNILVKNYKKFILKQLSIRLNKYHGLNYSSRLWNIILGHWLERIIKVTYNRHQSLEKCFAENIITGFTLTNDHFSNFIPKNSNEALSLFNDVNFNSFLFSLILKKYKKDYELDYSSDYKGVKENNTISYKKISFKRYLKYLLNIFNKKSKFFYITTYLPFRILLRLSLSHKQLPSFYYESIPEESKPYDFIFREDKLFTNTLADFKEHEHDEFIQFLNNNLLRFLPSSFVELFKNYENHSRDLNWPHYPSRIFTSNNFDVDDVFKIWLVNSINKGATYFVGQHGNNYGTSKYLANNTVEEETANGFISWGWFKKSNNLIKGFYFKQSSYKKRSIKKISTRTKVLIITLPMLYQYNTWDDCFEYQEYLKKLSILLTKISNLPTKKNFLVRLHHAKLHKVFDESAYLQDKFKKLSFDDGTLNINNLYKKHSLVVHTYDSTGIFETLVKNIPTLILIYDGFESHNNFGRNIYQILKDADILFFTSEKIFTKISKVESNCHGWWNSRKIQDARIKFLDSYAIESKSPVRDLHRAFNSK